MRKRWQVKDLIDLEYLLHMDGNIEDESSLRKRDQRDRSIYLDDIEPKLAENVLKGSEKRNFILRQWLECRRRIEVARGAVLPGELFTQAYTLLFCLFITAGVMLGAGTALSLLVYSGDKPVNVTLYFSVLVLMQLILLLILAGYMIRWRKSKRCGGLSVFQPLIGAFFGKLMIRVREGILEKTASAHRSSFLYAVTLVKGKSRAYGSLFHRPLFIMAQVFGISFNIGALSATLLRVLSVDLAFGWQSTVQLGSPVVYRIVSVISLPWAWALPSHISHPTLDQISGSRMLLKEGIYHLSTGDLVSWWPFLCLCVLFYGFLPRMVLLTAGKIALNRSLSRLGFNTIPCERLLHRLATPLFDIRGSAGSMHSDKPQQESPESDRGSLDHLSALKPGNGSAAEPLTAHGPSGSDAAGKEAVREGADESVEAYYRKSVFHEETGKEPEECRGKDMLQAGKTPPCLPGAYPPDGSMVTGEPGNRDLAENSGKDKKRDSAVFHGETPVSEKSCETEAEYVPALVSEEIIDDCSDRELETVVFRNFGCRLSGIHCVSFDLDEDERYLSPLAGEIRGADRPRLFVLQEGWQPPIRETLLFYRGLRELLGEEPLIFVGLIGKPVPDTIFTRVDEENLLVWNREMGKLGDPQLLLERLLYR